MKKAIITGISGQDGTYLYKYLESKGYTVYGIDTKRNALIPKGIMLKADLSDAEGVCRFIKRIKPDEIYHLAAFHHSSQDKGISESAEVYNKSYEVHVAATRNILEAIRRFSKKTRFFFAGSCHMFGKNGKRQQDETTPFNPDCVYGITKYAGARLCRFYRTEYSIFASVGILYNHESPLRGSSFVSKKIVESAVAIKRGIKNKLILGDIEASIDFGYAGDYVRAMHKIMQLKNPQDLIISSGRLSKVKDFASEVFDYLGLNWRRFVVVNKGIIRKKKKEILFGDNRRLKALTGWKPKKDMENIARIMVDSELER
ncbi:MAG: GDP-mannose 4,6-dehydratase [Candidatus Omnitrophica bacterium]|nr:GDP-mannose 4,6-dehydratase [Candidatus Omnitrophota bacterium]